MSKEFNDYMAADGIHHECTMPYTPQQNGVVERKNTTFMEMARCMLKSKNLPNIFWLDAMMCANYVPNKTPTKALKTITPYEA